jgi:predicted RNA binding protein YcfA (HicA-like mRNA interferase family)
VKVTNKDLHALIGKASREGFEVSRTNGGHIRLSRDGDATPVIVPNTPSDHRSVDNTRAELRRAGVTV